MGYALHVTRSSDRSEAFNNPITNGEVDALVAADPALQRSSMNTMSVGNPPVIITTKGDFLEWKGVFCFSYWEGEIKCSNPDEPHIRKLIEIASKLNARVVGDDGEEYKLHRSFFGRETIKMCPAEKAS